MDDQVITTKFELEAILLDESMEAKPLSLLLLKSITNNFSHEIGRGGFAVVYKGHLVYKKVAVKQLSQYFFDDKKFTEEVTCLMKAKHKNIVRCLGYCSDTQGQMQKCEGQFVMADVRRRLLCFEYVPKGTLDEYIKDASREWGECYKLIKGVCEGLHYLHKERIVHRDLKPANILLTNDMLPKITDFGISRCFGVLQTHHSTLNCAGSLGYLAPELINGNGKITFKSDIYSLGVIIREILTGYKGRSEFKKVQKDWSRKLEESQKELQLEQIRVCFEVAETCSSDNPEARPSAQEIIDILKQTGREKWCIKPVASSHNPRKSLSSMFATSNMSERKGQQPQRSCENDMCIESGGSSQNREKSFSSIFAASNMSERKGQQPQPPCETSNMSERKGQQPQPPCESGMSIEHGASSRNPKKSLSSIFSASNMSERKGQQPQSPCERGMNIEHGASSRNPEKSFSSMFAASNMSEKKGQQPQPPYESGICIEPGASSHSIFAASNMSERKGQQPQPPCESGMSIEHGASSHNPEKSLSSIFSASNMSERKGQQPQPPYESGMSIEHGASSRNPEKSLSSIFSASNMSERKGQQPQPPCERGMNIEHGANSYNPKKSFSSMFAASNMSVKRGQQPQPPCENGIGLQPFSHERTLDAERMAAEAIKLFMQAISKLYAGEKPRLSFSQYFSGTQNIVAYGKCKELYSAAENTMASEVQRLCRHLDDAAAPADSAAFLRELLTKWDRHNDALQYIHNLFKSIDSNFGRSNAKMPMYELGLRLWSDEMLRSDKIRSSLIEVVKRQNGGEDELVLCVKKMLTELGIGVSASPSLFARYHHLIARYHDPQK